MLELLSGKATTEQLRRRLGVHPETILRSCDAAIAGMADGLKQADGKTKRERELERELKSFSTRSRTSRSCTRSSLAS